MAVRYAGFSEFTYPLGGGDEKEEAPSESKDAKG